MATPQGGSVAEATPKRLAACRQPGPRDLLRGSLAGRLRVLHTPLTQTRPMCKPAVAGVLKSQHPFLKQAQPEVQVRRRAGLGLGGSPFTCPQPTGPRPGSSPPWTRPCVSLTGRCQYSSQTLKALQGAGPVDRDPGCPALMESTARGTGRHQSSDHTQGHAMNAGFPF